MTIYRWRPAPHHIRKGSEARTRRQEAALARWLEAEARGFGWKHGKGSSSPRYVQEQILRLRLALGMIEPELEEVL